MSTELQLIIPLIVAGIVVPIVETLKKLINPDGRLLVIKIGESLVYINLNLLISMGVSLVMALFALIITGAFSGQPVTGVQIVNWVSLTFAVASVIYKSSTTQKTGATKAS